MNILLGTCNNFILLIRTSEKILRSLIVMQDLKASSQRDDFWFINFPDILQK